MQKYVRSGGLLTQSHTLCLLPHTPSSSSHLLVPTDTVLIMYLQVIKDFLDEMEVQKEKVNAIHGPHQPHGPRCVRLYAVKILIYLSRRSKDSSVPLQAQSGPRFTAPVCAPNIVKLVMYISKTLMVPGARAASNGRAMPPSPPLSERYELYLSLIHI